MTMTRSNRVLTLVLLLILVRPVLAKAQTMSDFVGTWYSETKREGVVDGKPYDMRRELLQNRSDSTKTNTNRYYKGDTLVAEIVATYSWGVQDGLFWTECRTVLSEGQASLCSTRYEYDIVSINPRELRYTSRSSGTTYSSLRVKDDFRLP